MGQEFVAEVSMNKAFNPFSDVIFPRLCSSTSSPFQAMAGNQFPNLKYSFICAIYYLSCWLYGILGKSPVIERDLNALHR